MSQAANTKQTARHIEEVEELLLELSKQHAAAQAALPQTSQGVSGTAPVKGPLHSALLQPPQGQCKQPLPQEENDEGLSRSLTPLPPRLTTPASPSRRPSTHPWGSHTPPLDPLRKHPSVSGQNSVLAEHAQDESLRAERGRSFSSSFRWGKNLLTLLSTFRTFNVTCNPPSI